MFDAAVKEYLIQLNQHFWWFAFLLWPVLLRRIGIKDIASLFFSRSLAERGKEKEENHLPGSVTSGYGKPGIYSLMQWVQSCLRSYVRISGTLLRCCKSTCGNLTVSRPWCRLYNCKHETASLGTYITIIAKIICSCRRWIGFGLVRLSNTKVSYRSLGSGSLSNNCVSLNKEGGSLIFFLTTHLKVINTPQCG